MSYVSDEWIKADPDFWKPKPAAALKRQKKSRRLASKPLPAFQAEVKAPAYSQVPCLVSRLPG